MLHNRSNVLKNVMCWDKSKPTSEYHIDGLMQNRRDSSALAIQLRFLCNGSSIYHSIAFTCLHKPYTGTYKDVCEVPEMLLQHPLCNEVHGMYNLKK